MKDIVYNQTNALIRLRESELLTNDNYERMLQAVGMDGVEDVLKNTVYSSYLEESDFAQNFEAALAKEQQRLFDWLFEIAPEKDLVTIYTMRITFHNLKVLTKAELTNQNLDHLYLHDGQYDLETVKSAIHTRESNVLADYLMDSIREVADYFQESNLLQGIDIIYDRAFLTQQRCLAEKLGYPELLKEVIAFIDLTNISTMARGLIQEQHTAFLTTVLSSSGSIPKQTLLEFVGTSLQEFTDYLLTSSYGSLIKSIVSNETHEMDVVALDKIKDDYLTSMYQSAKIMAFGPLPILAFMNAKEVEWKNLRLIIVGKRSNFSYEQIKGRMRMSYVS